jgi:hypothetical protein
VGGIASATGSALAVLLKDGRKIAPPMMWGLRVQVRHAFGIVGIVWWEAVPRGGLLDKFRLSGLFDVVRSAEARGIAASDRYIVKVILVAPDGTYGNTLFDVPRSIVLNPAMCVVGFDKMLQNADWNIYRAGNEPHNGETQLEISWLAASAIISR